MNYFYLLVISILYFSAIGVRSSDILKAIEFKCNQTNDSENAFKNFKAAYEDFEKTFNLLDSEPGSYRTNYHLLCRPEALEQLYVPYSKTVSTLMVCLTTEEFYLENFLLQSYNYTAEQFCTRGGLDDFLEFSEYMSSSKCNLGGRDFQNNCIENTATYVNLETNNYILPQADLCSDLQFLQNCVKDVLSCKRAWGEVVNMYTGPFLRWCNSQ